MTMRFVVLGLVLLLLGSCTGLLIPHDYTDNEFAVLLAKYHFNAASDYVTKLTSTNVSSKRAADLAKQLTLAQTAYRDEVLDRAGKAQAAGNWQQAADEWRNGLAALPDDQQLQHASKMFDTAQRQRMQTLELELAELRADNLAHKIVLAGLLTAVAEDPRSWQKLLSGYQHEATELVPVLEPQAHDAEARGKWQQARADYRRLQSLQPGNEYHAALARAEKHIAQRKRSAQRARQTQLHDRYKQLSERFHQAVVGDDLSTAQKLLPQLKAAGGDRADVAKVASDLSDRIARRVESLVEHGRDEYTRGNLDAAIGSWSQALELDPDSVELKNRIERARRFRENVQRLSH